MPLLLTPASDPPDLRQRLTALRSHWRRSILAYTVCTLLAVGLGIPLVLGLLDYALSFPALVRAAVLVGLLTASGLFLRRGLLRPWRELRDDLALALRVEAHFPALNDALASTVQFEDRPDDDPDGGSATLRQVTRRLAVRRAEGCDFTDLLDPRPLRWAGIALTVVLLSALTLGLAFPAHAGTALARLLDPFGDHPWPPQTVMTVEAPTWLARGEPFLLRGQLTGVIPERVSFGFALDGTPAAEQTFAVVPEDDGGSIVIRLEPNRVPRGFRYRVKANDAETPWRTVRVLPPPQLAPLDGRPSPQIHLDFPAYTDLTPRELPDGSGMVECVTGTLVRVRAATDRPVARAWVELATDPPHPAVTSRLLALAATGPADAVGLTAVSRAVAGPLPASLSADGRRFELTFRPYVSGPHLLRFEDETGLGNRRPLVVLLQPDPSPAVTLERPSASQDTFTVLPDATVPLLARAEDILFAVRSVALEYRCGRDEPVQRLPLYEQQAFGTALPRMLADTPTPALCLRPPLVLADRRLDLKQFRHADGRPLREGDTLTLQVVADDFDDVTFGKPPGRSHEIELHIASPAALQTVLHRSLADVQRGLKEMLQLQRDALERSTPAETQRRQHGTLRPDDLDRLLQSEQMQQQLRNRLGNEQEGLRSAVDRLRQALRDNPLPRTPERDRLDALAAELDRLADEELQPIEPLLAEARKERGSVAPQDRKGGALPKAIDHQREAERALRELVDRMEPWSDARELRTEAGSLLRDQKRAARERADLQAKQGELGRSKDQLTPNQQEQLKRLEERQAALADRSNDLLQKLNQKLGDKQGARAAKEAEAQAKESQAAEREGQASDPDVQGTPRANELRREAGALRQQAEELREAAATLGHEADALAKARDAAQTPPTAPDGPKPSSDSKPADPNLAGQRRKAAQDIGANRLGEAKAAQETAAAMLQNMQSALEDTTAPDVDRLAKKLRAAEQELDELIQDQERLQKQTEDARQIADPAQRKEELERLSREQERMQERARELAQRLTRLRGDEAGRELRRAARAMDQARDQLEQGDPAEDKQDDALDRLDDAQAELTQTRKDIEEELQREQRAKLADALKGLQQRQQSQVAESERIFQEVKQAGQWRRDTHQKSLFDLAESQDTLGSEVEALTEKHFRDDKVIAHIIRLTAESLKDVRPAVEQVRDRRWRIAAWEADRRAVQAPQQLALRRLTQLLDALKPDDDARRAQAGPTGSGGADGGGGGGGGASDGVPPLARLKLLRELQADLNERTETFAQAHPDLTDLTPEAQTELDGLRNAQAELAGLLEEVTPPDPTPDPPAKEKK